MFTQIGTTPSELLEMSPEQIAKIYGNSGKTVVVGETQLIGKYVSIGNERFTQRTPKVRDLTFEYEWAESGPDTGKLMWIFIGSAHTGPLLSCYLGNEVAMWRNKYSSGDYGSDYARGGTTFSDDRHFPCLADTIADRDYLIHGVEMRRSRLIEGPALLEALTAAAALCSGANCKNAPGAIVEPAAASLDF
jgi:hypothetical protein